MISEEQHNLEDSEVTRDDRDAEEEQAQLEPETRLCGGQLNVVLEKVVEHSSKELEVESMQVEPQLEVGEDMCNHKRNTRTRSKLNTPLITRKS